MEEQTPRVLIISVSPPEPLPVNAPGAIGAISSELEFPWQIVRGIGSMSRAIGLIAHIREEIRDPMTREIQFRVEEEATEHLRGK